VPVDSRADFHLACDLLLAHKFLQSPCQESISLLTPAPRARAASDLPTSKFQLPTSIFYLPA
jgi:hypothetical protein